MSSTRQHQRQSRTLDDVRRAVSDGSLAGDTPLSDLPEAAWLRLAEAVFATEEALGDGMTDHSYLLLDYALKVLELYVHGSGPLSRKRRPRKASPEAGR